MDGISPPSNRTGFRRDSTTTAHRPGSRQSNGSRLRDSSASELMERRVFRLSSDKSGNVRVGVFPEGEELLIGFSGFCRVASERGAARQPQVGKRVELSPVGVLPRAAPI